MIDTPTPELSAAQVADIDALDELFRHIPPGPYDAAARSDGWEVRQIDTDPTNKHHWPYRLCQSIAGQQASCDESVFTFIAGVINAWPEIVAATRPSAPADAPVVVEFGKGALVVDTGTYGGAAAVFVAPTPSGNCGPVGHHARDEDRSPLDRLSPGEQVWTFPSKEQADAVYAAIFGDATLPAAPADQGSVGPEWRDIISAPRGGEIVKLGWWAAGQWVSTRGRYVRLNNCWADEENFRLEPKMWAPAD